MINEGVLEKGTKKESLKDVKFLCLGCGGTIASNKAKTIPSKKAKKSVPDGGGKSNGKKKGGTKKKKKVRPTKEADNE
jgi:hypothetical protein